MRLKNVTVATDKKAYFDIMQNSCQRNGIDLTVLGMNTKWKGFSMRFELLKKYLDSLSDENEIIMMNDAYDVVFLQNSSTIIKKFKKFNKKIVFSEQKGLLCHLTYYPFQGKILCIGNLIGYVKYVRELMNHLLKFKPVYDYFNNDDQIILGYALKHTRKFDHLIGVDTDQSIFFVTDGTNLLHPEYWLTGSIQNLELDGQKKRILNKKSKPISVLHLAANINGDKYLAALGYDLTKKRSCTSKLKQTFNIIMYNLEYYLDDIILLFLVLCLFLQ